MSDQISIPPLIPLPSSSSPQNTRREEQDDIFSTLFSPATPRASPAFGPISDAALSSQTTRPKPPLRHSRSMSTDSDFGSFVAVPSTEDPLHQLQGEEGDNLAFTPLKNFEFFDRFAENAKQANERNKKDVLDELLRHEDDPLYFLHSETPDPPSVEAVHESRATTTVSTGVPVPAIAVPTSLLDLDPLALPDPTTLSAIDLSHSQSNMGASQQNHHDSRRHPLHAPTLLTPSSPPLVTSINDITVQPNPIQSPKPPFQKQNSVLQELLTYEDDPINFHLSSSKKLSTSRNPSRSSTPLPSSTTFGMLSPDAGSSRASSTSRTPSRVPTPLQKPKVGSGEPSLLDLSNISDSERPPRHPLRQANRSEPYPSQNNPKLSSSQVSLSRQISPERSRPQPQTTQSSFFTASSLPARWVSSVSSLLLRANTAPTHQDDNVPAMDAHPRAMTIGGAMGGSGTLDQSITHGTPFASQIYVPPSGAPGFAGDRQWDKGFSDEMFGNGNDNGINLGHIKLLGRKEVTVPVLSVTVADKLRKYLPALKRLPKSWALLYSLDQHGISLNTLYKNCEDFISNPGKTQTGTIVAVSDAGGATFGVWMGEGIHKESGGYYGSGESFLWKIDEDDTLQVFKWTGKNEYVALCEMDFMSFGGGDGHYGLYLDSSLLDGSSARCPTFENEPLCSTGPKQGENVMFECVGLEVWGVV